MTLAAQASGTDADTEIGLRRKANPGGRFGKLVEFGAFCFFFAALRLPI